MKRIWLIIVVVVAATIIGVIGWFYSARRLSLPTAATPAPSPPAATPSSDQITIDTIASGLSIPWALAFAPDGRLFFTERGGQIRVVNHGKLQADPVATLTVVAKPGNEYGLLGLAVDPDFAKNHYLYVYYTYSAAGGEILNRISRLTETGGRADQEKVLIDSIPGNALHNGGRLKFGPDGKLYASVGDTEQPSLAQNTSSLAGKILRLNSDGSVPSDDPIKSSYVYSFGHRNVEGLAWQPVTGQLYATENGPTGNPCCHDEINKIVTGGNYGWPTVFGASTNSQFISPIIESGPTTTWAPSGSTFYTGNRLGQGWPNTLVFAGLKSQSLYRLQVSTSGQAGELKAYLVGQLGRMRDVVQGPDGYLYAATSNTDGRGTPHTGDDKILKIIPQG